jgi:ornithine cyclodeaminase
VRLYVDTAEAARKSGDLLGPLARELITPDDLRIDLAALCRAGQPVPPDGRRTVFKSVGTALEDLAAAMLLIPHPHPQPSTPQTPT